MAIYKMENHTQTGDTINWFDFKNMKIHGWKTGLKKGDEIQSNMESGKAGRFKIQSIKYMSDPQDQFFAVVKWIGYKK